MDLRLKEKFIELWNRYFHGVDLPIVLYYTDAEPSSSPVKPPPDGHRCLIGSLKRVGRGETFCFNADSIGCAGGKRYLGFTDELMPNFEYFLSCGIPGRLDGERYKKSPELVKEFIARAPTFKAPGRYVVMKRWDALEAADEPEVVVFFALPDVLSGLFTLANFDQAELDGVHTPFCAGCGAIVLYPLLEKAAERPRAVLGMFDVSARPYVGADILSFAAPMNRFTEMIGNMEESFLTTGSWEMVRKRISRHGDE